MRGMESRSVGQSSKERIVSYITMASLTVRRMLKLKPLKYFLGLIFIFMGNAIRSMKKKLSKPFLTVLSLRVAQKKHLDGLNATQKTSALCKVLLMKK